MNLNSFEGLSLTLKKRKLNISASDVSEHGNDKDERIRVLGHFDELDIKHIEKWEEWAPCNTPAISLNDEFVDKYVIKAYFPEYCKRAELQSQKFDYEIWNSDKEEAYPFTVVSVMNISEKYVRKVLESQKDINEILFDQINQLALEDAFKDLWEDLHCAVCPTIGFSDFVILFRTAKLKKALDFVEQLKQVRYDNVLFLSNAYTMIGFQQKGLTKLDESDVGDLKFAVRFSLRAGVSAACFQEYLSNKIKEYRIDKNLVLDDDQKYHTVGEADCLIISDMEIRFFLPLYFYENNVPNIFHPAHEMFEKYIRSMHSEIRVSIRGQSTGQFGQFHETEDFSEKYAKYDNEYGNYIQTLTNYVNKKKRPVRIVYGIQIVMKRFLELVQSGHCFDVEKIIGDAFKCLEKCTNQHIADDNEEDVQFLFDALNMFREVIGDYLADMQRSDSLSLEGRSLSHPSIGSATKLLLFYNGYINEIKKILCNDEADRYCFIVTSGGTDRTRVIDLFSHLNPSVDDANSLLIMTMPELSLYMIRESLFHIFHEVLHFCGERKRKERARYVVDAVSGYIAYSLGKYLKEYQKNRYIPDGTAKDLFSGMETEIGGIIEEKTKKLITDLKTGIDKRINESLFCSNSELVNDETNYYGRYFYPILEQKIMESVFDLSLDKDSFLKEVYALFLEYRIEIAEQISEELKNNKVWYSNANIYLNFDKEWKKRMNEKEPRYNSEDLELIHKFFNRVLGKVSDDPADNEGFELEVLLDIVKDLFRECYADCMAQKLLVLPIEDFLYSFLADAWNEENAFSNETFGQLRFKVDLEYSYGNSNALTTDQKKCIAAKKGLINIETKNVIDWIDELLYEGNATEAMHAIIDPICNYLKVCEEEWEKDKVFENANKRMKLDTGERMDCTSDIYSFLDVVKETWTKYVQE